MNDKSDVLGGMLLELRRGTVILSVLSQLDEPQYGYHLVQSLKEKGLTVDPGTLYPLLRRLEKQGVLESKWDTNEARPRKYYLLSTAGKEIYDRLCEEWRISTRCLEGLINN